MARETEETPFLPSDATIAETRQEILRCADEVRALGAGNQAERLRRVADLLAPPTIKGILRSVQHPRSWPTRKHTLWMAAKLSEAADLIRELVEDAKITGSERVVDRARQLLADLGMDEVEGTDGG